MEMEKKKCFCKYNNGILYYFKHLCHKCYLFNFFNKHKPEDLYVACAQGHVKTVEFLFKNYEYDLTTKNNALLLAVLNKYTDIVKIIIEQGANNLDECLEKSKASNMEITEILVKKGANVKIGLRIAKSNNIMRMLHRFEQKTENII